MAGVPRLQRMPARGQVGTARIRSEIHTAAGALASTQTAPLDRPMRALVGSKPAQPSVIEEMFAQHVRAQKLPAPEREFRFDPTRRWRMDFAWPVQRVAVEVEGGIHSGGRHTRGTGFEQDARKYLAAMLAGWVVVRVTGKMVRDGTAVDALCKLLTGTQK